MCGCVWVLDDDCNEAKCTGDCVFGIVSQGESGAGFNMYDLRLMIHDRGVRGQCLSDAIVSLHTALNRVCCDGSLGDLLSTRHLLRCAELCKQQLDLGVAMETALADAAMDVYVRSMRDRSVAQVRKSFCDVAHKHDINKVLNKIINMLVELLK